MHQHEDLEIILELKSLSVEERQARLLFYIAKTQHEILEVAQSNNGFLSQIVVLLTPLNPQPLPSTSSFQEIPLCRRPSLTSMGQTSTASITPLLADGVTPSGGTLSSIIYSFTDPSATVVLNTDGTALVTGVAASTGAVSGTAQCTVTDTDGAVATFSQGFTITTLAVVPPSQLTQSIAVNFTTPTP